MLVKKIRPGILSTIFSWTILSTLVGAVVISIIDSTTYSHYAAPTSLTFDQSFTAVRDDADTPTGEPGYTVHFSGYLTTVNYSGPVQSGSLSVSIRPDVGPAVLVTIDPVTLAWQASGGDQPLSGDVFDSTAALRVLESAEIDTSPAYLLSEADLLANAVDYIHRDANTAINADLGLVPTSAHAGQIQQAPPRSWNPFYLDITGEETGPGDGREFWFESIVSDTHEVPVFEGRVALDIRSVGSSYSLDTVRLSLRPSKGWPVEMVYDPATMVATITRADQVSEYHADSHHAAVMALRDMAGISSQAGDLSQGLNDIADLIADAAASPHTYVESQPSASPASPPPDGVPDGGFVCQSAANANHHYSYTSRAGLHMFTLISLLVGIVVYLAGVVLIIFRRRMIYVEVNSAKTGKTRPT